MNWLDDSILVVASNDESAVLCKFLNRSTKSWLNGLSIRVVKLVKNYYFGIARQRDGRSKLPNLCSECVDVTILGAIDNNPISTKLIA